MAALPKELQYNKPMAGLPADTQMNNVIVRPSNGSSFSGDGNIIQLDLPAHSFLVPSSLVLSANIKVTPNANTDKINIRGVPAASWLSRVETIVGGSLLESVTEYGKLYNMISACKLSNDENLSLFTEFGYGGGGVDGTDTPDYTLLNLKGRTGPTSTGTDGAEGTFPVSLPLGCLLSSCAELIPLGHMGGVRIQLTTAQVSEYVTAVLQNDTATTLPTMTFSDIELSFDLVDFGSAMDGVVRSMADANGDLVLKSQSWNNSSVNFPQVGAAGSTATYIFNTRLSSIKSLVLQGTGEAGADAINEGYDAVQITGKAGSLQAFVANRPYPPTPLRASNDAAVKSHLRQAFGEAHDVYSSRNSISPKGWTDYSYLAAADATATTVQTPAQHYYGLNTEKLSTNSVMMSGVSSQLTPINIRINTTEATAAAATLTLYTCYDALVSINVPTRQIAVRV